MKVYMDTQKMKQKKFRTAPDPEHDFFFFPKAKDVNSFYLLFLVFWKEESSLN